jgi:hypothetical protein
MLTQVGYEVERVGGGAGQVVAAAGAEAPLTACRG